jgi:hypothetical protein
MWNLDPDHKDFINTARARLNPNYVELTRFSIRQIDTRNGNFTGFRALVGKRTHVAALRNRASSFFGRKQHLEMN